MFLPLKLSVRTQIYRHRLYIGHLTVLSYLNAAKPHRNTTIQSKEIKWIHIALLQCRGCQRCFAPLSSTQHGEMADTGQQFDRVLIPCRLLKSMNAPREMVRDILSIWIQVHLLIRTNAQIAFPFGAAAMNIIRDEKTLFFKRWCAHIKRGTHDSTDAWICETGRLLGN